MSVEQETFDQTPVSYGKLLRHYRLSRQLTQEELAHAAGLSIRAVRNAECGRVGQPRKGSVSRLADALRLSDDERRQLVGTALARRRPSTEPPSAQPADAANGHPVNLVPGRDVIIVLQRITTPESDDVHIAAGTPNGDVHRIVDIRLRGTSYVAVPE
jgi:transcriptional regulator with XRE-family HTH domain